MYIRLKKQKPLRVSHRVLNNIVYEGKKSKEKENIKNFILKYIKIKLVLFFFRWIKCPM